MSIVNIASQTDASKIAGILGAGALRVQAACTAFAIPSGTATGVIFSGPGIFNAIVGQATGGSGNFWLWDTSDSASAAAIGVTAGVIARYNSVPLLCQVYNALVNGALVYRLSGANTDGITILYSAGGFTL